MILQNIDTLRGVYLRFRHEYDIIFGTIVLGAVYLFSVNENILYLILLWVIYIIFSALFTRFRTMLISLAACLFFAVTPINIIEDRFINPAPNMGLINPGYPNPYMRIRPLKIWQYIFKIDDLEKYQIECGGNLQGGLVIDGRDLSGLEINVEGNTSSGTAQYIKKYGLEEIQMPLDVNILKEVVVLLHAKTEKAPKIYLGPESHGFDIYSDAVWLEFKNERCTVIYHAQRHVITIGNLNTPIVP